MRAVKGFYSIRQIGRKLDGTFVNSKNLKNDLKVPHLLHSVRVCSHGGSAVASASLLTLMLENGFQANYKVSMPASTLMLRLGVNRAYLTP